MLFTHTYVDNHAKQTLFLFHGTGGSENDFIFLDEMLHKSYNLVGLRGNVIEDGMSRFFRRLAPGVFDEESIRIESNNIKVFIDTWKNDHNTKSEDTVCLGYSNGANILLASVFYYPHLIQKGLFLHPMMPVEEVASTIELSILTAFVSYGTFDQMVPMAESKRVVDVLTQNKAVVEAHEYPVGHEIGAAELSDIVSFLEP